MRLLLDENAPMGWLALLDQLDHHVEHVYQHGLGGQSDKEVLAFALAENFTLLSLNKFKKGPDRRDALAAMTNGARIVRVTAKGLSRQEQALGRRIDEVEGAFQEHPDLRRATIMNDFRVRYDAVSDIRRMLEGGDA